MEFSKIKHPFQDINNKKKKNTKLETNIIFRTDSRHYLLFTSSHQKIHTYNCYREDCSSHSSKTKLFGSKLIRIMKQMRMMRPTLQVCFHLSSIMKGSFFKLRYVRSVVDTGTNIQTQMKLKKKKTSSFVKTD